VHVPDGFIAPVVYGPAYGAAGALWAVSVCFKSMTGAALPALVRFRRNLLAAPRLFYPPVSPARMRPRRR